MPTYCYEDQFGQVIEQVHAIGEAPIEIKSGGSVYRRSFQAESASVPASAGWPMECVSSGVNAEQAGELREHFKKMGVPTDVTERGNPSYRDAKHRKKALACRQIHDNDSYM